MQQQVQEARTESQQWQARHAEAGRSLTELQEQRTTMIQELGRLQALYEQATQRLTEVTQQQEHIRAQAQETRLESQQWHERYVATEDFLTVIQDRLQQTVGKTTMAAQRLKTLQEDLVQLRQALAAPDKR
jgi:flagellar biosynthesis chaperone FliJ